MANFTLKQQQEILKKYAQLVVKDWPADKEELDIEQLYTGKKLLKDFLNVMPISPKAHVGGCVNIARLVSLKYNLKGYALDDFIIKFDYSEFDKYELLDTLKGEA